MIVRKDEFTDIDCWVNFSVERYFKQADAVQDRQLKQASRCVCVNLMSPKQGEQDVQMEDESKPMTRESSGHMAGKSLRVQNRTRAEGQITSISTTLVKDKGIVVGLGSAVFRSLVHWQLVWWLILTCHFCNE